MANCTLHLKLGEATLQPWAVSETASDVWIEVELIGINELAQQSTKRLPVAAFLDFGWEIELPAGARTSVSKALRSIMTSEDEEDADLTFTLKALGPRKKSKEIASGYINLRTLKAAGADLVRQTVALIGTDEKEAGMLTVSLKALDAIVVAMDEKGGDASEEEAAPAQPSSVSNVISAAVQAQASGTPAAGEELKASNVPGLSLATDTGIQVVETLESSNSLEAVHKIAAISAKHEETNSVAEVVEDIAEDISATVENDESGPAGVDEAKSAKSAPGGATTHLERHHSTIGSLAVDGSTKPTLLPVPATNVDPGRSILSTSKVTTVSDAISASESVAPQTVKTIPVTTTQETARNMSESNVDAELNGNPSAVQPAASQGVEGEKTARSGVSGTASHDSPARVEFSGEPSTSRPDKNQSRGTSIPLREEEMRMLTPHSRQRELKTAGEEERRAAAAARRAAARAAHKANLAALRGDEYAVDASDRVTVAVLPEIAKLHGGVGLGSDVDENGVTRVSQAIDEDVPSGPEAWRLGILFEEMTLLLPAVARRYKLRARVGGDQWFESRAVRPVSTTKLHFGFKRNVYVGPGSVAYVALNDATKRRRDGGEEGLAVEVYQMGAARGDGAEREARPRWDLFASVAISWRQVLTQESVDFIPLILYKPTEGWGGPAEQAGELIVQLSIASVLAAVRTAPELDEEEIRRPPSPALEVNEIRFTVSSVDILPAAAVPRSAALTALPAGQASLASSGRIGIGMRHGGIMLQIELSLGEAMLSEPFTSREVLLPEAPLAVAGTSPHPRTVRFNWNRCVPLVHGSSLWSALAAALADADGTASELRFALMAITGRGTRRTIGTAALSLRSVLLSGQEPLEESIRLRDARSQDAALLWLTLEALPALAALAPKLAPSRVLIHSAGASGEATNAQFIRLKAVVRFQSHTRGLLARRRALRDAGGHRHAISVQLHELMLPTDETSKEIDSAFVSLTLFGQHLGSTSSMRGKVGSSVHLNTVRTVAVERGTAVYAAAVRCLRSGAPSLLKASVAAIRRKVGGGNSRVAQFEQFEYGEARLDLSHLLRAPASDLVFHMWALSAPASSRPIGATLVITVEAIEALAPIARALNLPVARLLAANPSRLRVATAIVRAGTRIALLAQAWARGQAERRLVARMRADAGLDKCIVVNNGGPIGNARRSIFDNKDIITIRLVDLQPAVENGSAPSWMVGRVEVALELRLGEMGGQAGPRLSSWAPPIVPGNQGKIGAGPTLVEAILSMRHGGVARSVVRDALYTGHHERTAARIRLLRRQLADSQQAALLAAGLGSLAYEAMAKGGTEVTELATGSLPILALEPQADNGDKGSAWVELRMRTVGGRRNTHGSSSKAIAKVRLEIDGLLLLRRLVSANRERWRSEFGSDELSKVNRHVGDAVDDISEARALPAVRDLVDEMVPNIIEVAASSARKRSELCVSQLFSNPEAVHISSMLERATFLGASITHLDLSYCLALQGAALADALDGLPVLKHFDASNCELKDAGAKIVAKALLKPFSSLDCLRLRGNRIGPNGSRAVAKGLARTASLRTLDLSDNELGDAGLAWISVGSRAGFRLSSHAPLPSYIAPARSNVSRASRAFGAVQLGAALRFGQGEGRSRRLDDSPADEEDSGDGDASLNVGNPEPHDSDASGWDGALPQASLRRRPGPRRSAPIDTDSDEAAEANLAAHVGAGLISNSSLTALLLSNNHIGSDALRLLARALATHAGLVVLDLGVNSLRPQERESSTAVAKPQENNAILDSGAAPTDGSDAGGWAPSLEEAKRWRFPDGMRTFGESLGRLASLRALRMQYNRAGANLGICVGRALGDPSSADALRELNLQGSPLSFSGVQALVEGLAMADVPVNISAGDFETSTAFVAKPSGPTGVELLNLEGCLRGAKGAMGALWAWLSKAGGALRRLNVAYNDLGLDDARALGEALATNTALRELDVGSNPLTPEGISHLCYGLHTNCTLQSLGLSYVLVGEPGARAIGELLSLQACALTAIHLDGCRISNEGLAAITAALAGESEPGVRGGRRGAKLSLLRLEDNGLGFDGTGPQACAALSNALVACGTLESLFLGNNRLGDGITDEGMRVLSAGIAMSFGLNTLDLGGNQLGPQGLRSLLTGLRAQQGITALEVSRCDLGDVGAEALALELQASAALRFVSAADNNICLAGGRALADAFDANPIVLQLNLSFNPAMAYKDLTRVRLTNVLRGGVNLVNPLDGLSKVEAEAANF